MKYPETLADFQKLVTEIQTGTGYKNPVLFGIGALVKTESGVLASVRYPVVNGPGQNTDITAVIMKVLDIKPEGMWVVRPTLRNIQEVLYHLAALENDGQAHPNIDALKIALRMYSKKGPDAPGDIVLSFLFEENVPVFGVEDATLRLYGRSLGLYAAHDQSISDILRALPNVIWEHDVPLDPETVNTRLLQAAFEGRSFAPSSASKIPLLMHRINPANLKRASPELAGARLGAVVDTAGNFRPFP